MKKYQLDLIVRRVERLRDDYVVLHLTHHQPLPTMLPGQFVEVKVDKSPTTFLRRPISINFVDEANNELWLLVHVVGEGTRAMANLECGSKLDCLLPLGNGYMMPETPGGRYLLIGGGVGTAPLLYYGYMLRICGCEPTFLLGGRTADDVMQLGLFEQTGPTYVTTEDGSMGECGYVTAHTVLGRQSFDRIATCGPKPMMMAVAAYAAAHGIECEASLENLMACGLGACLCCVEKTDEGNVCVCKDGPVFNVKRLQWQNSK